MAHALRDSVKNFEEKKQAALRFLDKLIKTQREFEKAFPENAGSLRLSVETLGATREKIAQETLRILIAGQFKTGKSALVNAMLGEAVLPAYSTPCTAVITEIEYGSTPGTVLCFKEEINRQALPQGLAQIVRQHILDHPDPVPPLELGLTTQEELEKYLVIDENEDDQNQGIATTPVAVCKLRWPLDFCAGNVMLIDSPGLNENGARDKTTMDYAPSADMILHVLNAQQCFGQPDAQFARAVKSMGAFPLLFLVNRYDLIASAKERERLRNYALKKLSPYSSYGEKGIFFTSAEQGLKGRKENDSALLAVSGVPAFESAMAEIFNRERIAIKLGHIMAVIRDLDRVTQARLPQLEKALGANLADLEKQYASQEKTFQHLDKRIKNIKDTCERQINAFQERFQLELKSFVMDFVQNDLENIIETVDISGLDVTDNEGKTKAATLLMDAMDQALSDALLTWFETTGQPLWEKTFAELRAKLEDELDEFNLLITTLRDNLTLNPTLPGRTAMSLYADDGGLGIVGGLAAGGGVAGIAAIALLPARFLGGAGPVGWAIALVAAALGAVLHIWGKARSRQSLKESFMIEAWKRVSSQCPEWAESKSMDAANYMGECVLPMIEELEKRVEDSKRPILMAIDTLKAGQAEAQAKALRLKVLSEEFDSLAKEGAELLAAIQK